MRAFDFMVALWGSEYRSRFLRYCLASLRAPGNLPRLSRQDGHRLLIATPTADWNALQQTPQLQAIRAHITPEWVPISDPASTPPGSSAAVRQLNTCQTLLVQEAHRRGSMACMLPLRVDCKMVNEVQMAGIARVAMIACVVNHRHDSQQNPAIPRSN